MTEETALLAYGCFFDWTLPVGDSGGRMHADLDIAKAGLGTSLAEAIARQFYPKVGIADANPGTTV